MDKINIIWNVWPALYETYSWRQALILCVCVCEYILMKHIPTGKKLQISRTEKESKTEEDKRKGWAVGGVPADKYVKLWQL